MPLGMHGSPSAKATPKSLHSLSPPPTSPLTTCSARQDHPPGKPSAASTPGTAEDAHTTAAT
eukprot:scaffold174401_cov33-Prasinocladus_malaysianus.AAC.1